MEVLMALFGRDYDQDYGRDYRRGGMFGYRAAPAGYDRDYPRERPAQRAARDEGPYGATRGRPAPDRYDRAYGSRGYAADYDRGYKSRWQTDHGDPFGDRTSHTPMRVIQGEYRNRSDRNRDPEGRGWSGRDRKRYEADYYSNPMGYDPYRSRESSMERGWGMREMGRGRYGRDFRDERF
jgi:hypothetical protein